MKFGIWVFSRAVISKIALKFCYEHFLPRKLGFFGGELPPKSGRRLNLSDFDEIWHLGVFECAAFKYRIHFDGQSFPGSL